MKKINSSLVSIFMLLVCMLSVQSVFAIDVPLKKGDSGSIGGSNIMMSRSVTIIPVSASFDGTDLYLTFSSKVGVAQVTVIDQFGSIVYMQSVDTNSTSTVVIPTDSWDSGTYTLQVTYGTTTLSGTINL
ncbi:MAG: DUF3244 domain-containing protein [Paludibacter sp.]|nr:DUF3244 domain-containing protein [Paludibacter sp.]